MGILFLLIFLMTISYCLPEDHKKNNKNQINNDPVYWTPDSTNNDEEYIINENQHKEDPKE